MKGKGTLYLLKICTLVTPSFGIIWELLEMESFRPQLRPTELESTFYQDSQVICMNLKVQEELP